MATTKMTADKTAKFIAFLAKEYHRLWDSGEYYEAAGTLRLWQQLTGNLPADKSERGTIPERA